MADDATIRELRGRNLELLKDMQTGLTKLNNLVSKKHEAGFEESNFTTNGPLQKLKAINNFFDSTFSNATLAAPSLVDGSRRSGRRVTSTPKVFTDALRSEGNFRAPVKKDLSRRSILKTPKNRKERDGSNLMKSRETPTSKKNHRVSFLSNAKVSRKLGQAPKMKDESYLGYDWIAGVIDNESKLADHSDAYLKEINEFRRINKQECFSAQGSNYRTHEETKLSSVEADDNKENSYACAGQLFMVNDRLQPVPIHGPGSYCPICTSKKESESEYEGSFIRVSVPRSTLESPYRVRPHRRKSYDPSDSVALSEHCLAGWQSSWPASAPQLATLDLKSAVVSKCQDLRKVNSPRLRTKRLIDSSYIIEHDHLMQKQQRKLLNQEFTQ